MEVFIVKDEDDTILGVYSGKNLAIREASKGVGRSIGQYEVQEEPINLKSMKDLDKKEYKTHDMNDIMPFGKYKGEYIEDIITKDPKYIDWCIQNLDFSLNEISLEYLQNCL